MYEHTVCSARVYNFTHMFRYGHVYTCSVSVGVCIHANTYTCMLRPAIHICAHLGLRLFIASTKFRRLTNSSRISFVHVVGNPCVRVAQNCASLTAEGVVVSAWG
jgi:hypothetical protein